MVLILVFIFILFLPWEAHAWGPGVHLALGEHVLTQVHLLAPGLASLLTAHAHHFLYGCLSADIFIGKGCVQTPKHSHNWETGRALLRQAKTPALTAYAHGYLTHLAADVIAHNYLVPNMLGFSAGRGKMAHTYVEMMADLMVADFNEQVSQVFSGHFKDEDQSLIATMQQKQLVFNLKKKIFEHSLKLTTKGSYQRSLRFFKKITSDQDQDLLMAQSLEWAQALVMDLLQDPCHSPALECDPIGSAKLLQIRSFRRKQRLYYHRHQGGIIFPLDSRLEARLGSGSNYA